MSFFPKYLARSAIVAIALALSLSSRAEAQAVTITTPEDFFVPDAVSIAVGTTVTWDVTGPHDVIQTTGPNCEEYPGGFASAFPAGTFSVVFDQPGVYYYMCTPHCVEGMMGVITVVEGTGGSGNQGGGGAGGSGGTLGASGGSGGAGADGGAEDSGGDGTDGGGGTGAASGGAASSGATSGGTSTGGAVSGTGGVTKAGTGGASAGPEDPEASGNSKDKAGDDGGCSYHGAFGGFTPSALGLLTFVGLTLLRRRYSGAGA